MNISIKKDHHLIFGAFSLFCIAIFSFACERIGLPAELPPVVVPLEAKKTKAPPGNEIEIRQPQRRCAEIGIGGVGRPKASSFISATASDKIILANSKQYDLSIMWETHEDYRNCTLPLGSTHILERRKRVLLEADFADDDTGWEDVSSTLTALVLSNMKSGKYKILNLDWYSKYEYRLRLFVPGHGESENTKSLEFETEAPPSPMLLEAKVVPEYSTQMSVRWTVKEDVYNDSRVSYHLRWRQKSTQQADFTSAWQHVMTPLTNYRVDFYSNRIYIYDYSGTRETDYEWQVRSCVDIDITDTVSRRGVSETNPSCSDFLSVRVNVPLAPPPVDIGPDDDGDRKANVDDDCPNGEVSWISSVTTDHDGDGCRDATEDLDDDNDGVNDLDGGGDPLDKCPRGERNWRSHASNDYDGDGCRDGTTEDPNSDGDRYPNDSDNCPYLINDQADRDGNGIGDACDSDIDGDGVDNFLDHCDDPSHEFGWTSDLATDYDGDGCRADVIVDEDTDDDGDGIIDSNDNCNPTAASAVSLKPARNWVSNATSDLDGDGCRDMDEDVDDDNNGLLEIHTIAEFGYIRHNLKGTSLDKEADDVDDPGDNTDDGAGVGNISGHPVLEPTNCSGRDTTLMIDGAPVTTHLCGYEIVLDSGFLLDLSGEANWQPIGSCGSDMDTNGDVCGDSDDNLFTAILDATYDTRSTVVSNLSINRSTENQQGLFAGLGSGAIVRNLSITSVNIRASSRVAAIAGWSSDATIEDSFVTGRVSGTSNVGGLIGESAATIRMSYISASVMTDSISGAASIGGLVGSNSGTIADSYSAIQVTGTTQSIGGLVGTNSGIIERSYATGAVTGGDNVGGLVGYNNLSASAGSLRLSHSYATNSVSGGDNVGGLVGYSLVSGDNSNMTIANSYATGAVIGNGNVGALLGHSDVSGDGSNIAITNGYALGAVMGTRSVGGLLGYSEVTGSGSNIRVATSYWDLLTTGQLDSNDAVQIGDVGYDANTNTYRGLPTDQMQSAATDATIRNMGSAYVYVSGSYPRLLGVGNSLSSSDSDGDGIMDTQEIACGSNPTSILSMPVDTDSDGDCDPHDMDDDNDSWPDSYELSCGSGHLDASSVPQDTDHDGKCNHIDNDDDNDGWLDTAEQLCGSNPLSATSTLANSPTCKLPSLGSGDIDEDGIVDSEDVDDDNDGLIEIHSFTDLDHIRYNVNGTSYDDELDDAGTSFANCGEDSNQGSICGAPITRPFNCAGRTTSTNLCGYELAVSIDATGSAWVPIVGYAAIFDGNRTDGHEITGITINLTANDNVGFFSNLTSGASVRNLALVVANITGNNYVGGVVGRNVGGSIENSFVSGSVSGNNYVGGLVGHNEARTGTSLSINHSHTTASASGVLYTGGLIGYNDSDGGSIVINSNYASGNVSGTTHIGGLLGYNDSDGGSIAISNSYASGSVSGTTQVGGLVGFHRTSNGGTITVRNSYWDLQSTGQTGSADAPSIGDPNYNSYRGLSTVEMQSDGIGMTIRNLGSAYAYASGYYPQLQNINKVSSDVDSDGFADIVELLCGSNPLLASSKPHAFCAARMAVDTDGDGTYDIYDDDDDGDGILDAEDVDDDNDGLIEIYDLADLYNIRYNLSGDSYDDEPDDAGSTFASCGTDSNRGSICGAPAVQPPICAGRTTTHLCGYELMATLDFNPDCTVNDNNTPDYVSDDYCEANTSSPYYNSGNGWLPIGETTAEPFAAIFVGNRHFGYEIRNLYINRSATSTASYYGLFGFASDMAILRNTALVQVNITVANTTATKSYIGGLAGVTSGRIDDNFVKGRVMATGLNHVVGGLLGAAFPSSHISNSYTQVSVNSDNQGSVGGTDYSAGGLIGEVYYNSHIIASYATGSVMGNQNVGGLVGCHCRIYSFARGGAGSSTTVTSSIHSSYFSGNVVGNQNVGGLVGSNVSVGGYSDEEAGDGRNVVFRISNSYITGSVTGNQSVGGLVGFNYSRGGNSGSNVGGDAHALIINSYTVGNVNGSGNAPFNIGGLVGYNYGLGGNGGNGRILGNGHNGGSANSEIAYSYIASDVIVPQDNASNIGGLVGYNYSLGGAGGNGDNGNNGGNGGLGRVLMRNSYDIGDVTTDGSGTSRSGLLIGYNRSATGSNGNGGLLAGRGGSGSSDLQSSYSGVDTPASLIVFTSTFFIGFNQGTNSVTSSALIDLVQLQGRTDLGADYVFATGKYPFLQMGSAYETSPDQHRTLPRLYQWAGAGMDGEIGTSDDVYRHLLVPGQ